MKIRTDLISQFPIKALTERQYEAFLVHHENLKPDTQKAFTRTMLVIDAYVYSSNKSISLKSFNNRIQINQLLGNVIAFIYRHVQGRNEHLYNFSRYVIDLLRKISRSANVPLNVPKLSKVLVHEDVQALLNRFESVDESKIAFYKGWSLTDNKGKEIFVEMSFIREAYGENFTNKLFNALGKFCRSKKEKTVETNIKHFKRLFQYFIKLAPSLEGLERYLRQNNAVYYLTVIFNLELKAHIDNGGSGEAFCKSWRNKMAVYRECLIAYSVFQEPIVQLPVPKYKNSLSLAGSHIKHEVTAGESSGVFNNKLITKVPLKFTDNQAIREIITDVRRDIVHVLQASERSIDLNYRRLIRFNKYAELAIPKILGDRRKHDSYYDRKSVACATFNHYLWQHPGKAGGYSSFLGFVNKTSYLSKLLCIPTLHILYPLILKLVHEHPKITESWLINWQVFNENGKIYGFLESGDSWIIRSVKQRKGMSEAEQTVKLNDVSKILVEKIINHTAVARDFLQSREHDDYRYVLLTASLSAKPSKLKQITNLKKIDSQSFFKRALHSASPNVPKNRALEIAGYLTVNRMRASAGVEVFLKTNSVKKMCEALGHKEERSDLVDSYLPEPILRFFSDRWIRIFQNAIVFESMRDSKYLHRAIDLTPESLDEFLTNHRLKKISGHIWDGNVISTSVEIANTKQEGALLLSTPLLRILLFFFNSSPAEVSRFGLPINMQETWTQLSTLIITQIEHQLDTSSVIDNEFEDEIIAMYQEAVRRPISLKSFKLKDNNETN